MLNRMLFLFLLTLSVTAHADWKHYIGVGAHLDTYDEDLSAPFSIDDEYSPGFAAGWKTVGMWGNIGLRTGAMYEYHKLTVESTGEDAELKGHYVAVPVNLQIDVHDRWNIFGGITPRLLLTSKCENCGPFDEDSNFLTNFYNVGIGYKLGRNFWVEGNFNHGAGETYEDIEMNTTQVLFFYEFN